MSDSSELAELKLALTALQKKVALQQERLNVLRSFFSIQQAEGEPPSLHIRCWGISLSHPTQPSKTQAMLMSSDEGPYLALWGSDEKSRLSLTVKKDGAQVNLFATNLKTAVSLSVTESGGLGQIGVLANGSPRAVMKAAKDNSGVVSVVHEDGYVRACMSSTEHNGGDIMVVTPDMKTGVKITGNAPYGGLVAVHHANGKPGVILACSEASGAVLVNDSAGKLQATLPLT